MKEIYKATKCCWVINKNKVNNKNKANNIRYVLSAYRGVIIEVFEVNEWYPVEEERRGKSKTRWGFNGKVAQYKIRNLYLNKTVPSGQNPVRFNI